MNKQPTAMSKISTQATWVKTNIWIKEKSLVMFEGIKTHPQLHRHLNKRTLFVLIYVACVGIFNKALVQVMFF